MLASAIIVFREVLEAALVVGIVLAATQGLPRRNIWIVAGIGAGIAGSFFIAGFADVIAAAASGMGQELMNATVMFVAVVVLAWSIIWMRRHGRELSQRAKAVGKDVAEGGTPVHMLAVVVGLSVLREGAEAVLFLYGIAAGQDATAPALLLGGVLGVVAGAGAGYLIYRGLVRIAARHLFGVTAWLLAFLAAGMASQGAAALVAAGVLPPLETTAWDTSSLLSERNLVGQVLHTLVGYDSHPALIQVLFYVVTLGTIVIMMRLADNRRVLPGAGAVVAIVIASVGLPGHPRAENKVYSPAVHYGEYSIEARGNAAIDRGQATDEINNQKYEFEYGVTNWWQTALVAELNQNEGDRFRYNATGWENIFQLFEPGEAWMDSAIYLEYEIADPKGASDSIEAKLLLEKQVGPIVTTLNFIFEKPVTNTEGAGTEWGYAARTKYRLSRYLEPGVEAYGDVGPLRRADPIDQQTHRIGPMIMGAIPLASRVAFNYELGWLFGLTEGAPDHSIRWLGELEFRI